MMQRTVAALSSSAATLLLSSCVAIPNSYSTVEIDDRVSPWTVVPERPATAHQMPELPIQIVSFETTEGTFMSVDVSPDGETIVFDLLGDIYSVPVGGGNAIPLTRGRAWDRAPRFSPDGLHVYFVSDREAYKNLWRFTLADQSVRQITRSDRDILGGPNWSQDGSRLLAGVSVVTGNFTEFVLHVIHPINGAMTPVSGPDGPFLEAGKLLRQRSTVYSGVESADGKIFYSEAGFQGEGVNRRAVRLFVFDTKSQARTAITPAEAAYSDFKPQLSHDGKRLAYYRQYNDRRTELRILNRTTGEDAALVILANADDAEYTDGDDARPNYAFTPDDDSVIFWHGGKIHRVNIVDGSMNIVPFRVSVERNVVARAQPTVQRLDEFGEATTIRWPSLSRDGQTMVFSAFGYVWVMDMPTGDVRRLSDSDDFEYMPTISPDGSSVAYICFSQSGEEYGLGRLMVADLAGGKTRELLAEANEDYILPKWSADGSMIAVIREVDRRKGIKAVFGWTPAARGAFHEVVSPTAFDDHANLWGYARSVEFDATGGTLLVNYPQSRTKTVLVAADLDTGTSRTLAVGTSEVGGIAPAPDLKHLALTRRDGSIRIIPFEVGEEPTTVSSLAANARRVSENAGYYVDWNDANQFTFGFAKNVHRYRVDDDDLESVRIKVPVAKPEATQMIAFTGARLITMSGEVGVGAVIESGTLIVDGARIMALGPASAVKVPPDAMSIDVTGKTIMPGLLDTHYHAGGHSALALPAVGWSEKTAINFGVTSAWDPTGRVSDGDPAIADLQNAGRIKGPRWSPSANSPVGYPYEFLTSYPAALAAVERNRDLGVSVLKEAYAPTREQQEWLSAAARESGLGIVSHLEYFEGTMTRIIDGYTGGDHSYVPVPYYKDMDELLRQTGYIWTPNVTITAGTIGEQKDRMRFYCDAITQRQEQSVLEIAEAKSICNLDQEEPTVSYRTHRVSRVAAQAGLAASNGVNIGVSAHNKPGSNLHQEMWFLWRGGMPIADVLRATTMVNAGKLGLQEDIGSLEPGKMADFLVLDENPLDNILYSLSLKYTVQGGVIYDSATAERVNLSEIAVSRAKLVEAADDDDGFVLRAGTEDRVNHATARPRF